MSILTLIVWLFILNPFGLHSHNSMPQPTKKSGMDYSRLKQKLAATDSQTKNNALYQSIYELVEGAMAFQGHINAKFNEVENNHASHVTNIEELIAELEDRNNSKY